MIKSPLRTLLYSTSSKNTTASLYILKKPYPHEEETTMKWTPEKDQLVSLLLFPLFLSNTQPTPSILFPLPTILTLPTLPPFTPNRIILPTNKQTTHPQIQLLLKILETHSLSVDAKRVAEAWRKSIPSPSFPLLTPIQSTKPKLTSINQLNPSVQTCPPPAPSPSVSFACETPLASPAAWKGTFPSERGSRPGVQ